VSEPLDVSLVITLDRYYGVTKNKKQTTIKLSTPEVVDSAGDYVQSIVDQLKQRMEEKK